MVCCGWRKGARDAGRGRGQRVRRNLDDERSTSADTFLSPSKNNIDQHANSNTERPFFCLTLSGAGRSSTFPSSQVGVAVGARAVARRAGREHALARGAKASRKSASLAAGLASAVAATTLARASRIVRNGRNDARQKREKRE